MSASPPGKAYQFDWGHEVVLINSVTVKVAHVRLCHSRTLFARACPRETQEMVVRRLRFFGQWDKLRADRSKEA